MRDRALRLAACAALALRAAALPAAVALGAAAGPAAAQARGAGEPAALDPRLVVTRLVPGPAGAPTPHAARASLRVGISRPGGAGPHLAAGAAQHAGAGAADSRVFRRALLFGAAGSVAGSAAGYGAAWLLDRQFGTGQEPAFVGVIVGSIAGTALGVRAGARSAGGSAGSLRRSAGGAALGLLAGAAVASALRGPAGEGVALAAFPLVQATVAAFIAVRQ